MHIEGSRRLICDVTNTPIDKGQILFQEFGDYMIFRIKQSEEVKQRRGPVVLWLVDCRGAKKVAE